MVLKRKSMPFVIASLLCVPFLAFLVLVLIRLGLSDNVHCPDFIEVPFIWGCIWLGAWTFMSLPVLALVAVSVFVAWFQEGKTRFEIIFTGIYSVVISLYIGWVLYCLFSNAKFDL